MVNASHEVWKPGPHRCGCVWQFSGTSGLHDFGSSSLYSSVVFQHRIKAAHVSCGGYENPNVPCVLVFRCGTICHVGKNLVA